MGKLDLVHTLPGKNIDRLRSLPLIAAAGSDLLGLSYKPLFLGSAQTTEIIPASYVTTDTGTGLVHCAPAHGAEDYATWNTTGRGGELTCHVDADGKFNDETPNPNLVGKEVLGDGSEAMVELLRERGQLVKDQWVTHRYPYDWKTKKPVIVTYVLPRCTVLPR